MSKTEFKSMCKVASTDHHYVLFCMAKAAETKQTKVYETIGHCNENLKTNKQK